LKEKSEESKLTASIAYGLCTLIILGLQYYLFIVAGFRVEGAYLPGILFVLFIPLIHAIAYSSLSADFKVSAITTLLMYWILELILIYTYGKDVASSQRIFLKSLIITPIFCVMMMYVYRQLPKYFKK